MPRKNYRPSEPTSEWLLPQPSEEGVTRLRATCLGLSGKEPSREQAGEMLAMAMRHQYLLALINAPGPGAGGGTSAPGAPAPLGYRSGENGRWEEDPHDGPLVRRALEMRKEGATIRAVCAEMGAAGLRSRRGNAIGPSSMLKILANPAYRETASVDDGAA